MSSADVPDPRDVFAKPLADPPVQWLKQMLRDVAADTGTTVRRERKAGRIG